jgi:hypothetical protein
LIKQLNSEEAINLIESDLDSHIMVLGSSGSGKTSGPGRYIKNLLHDKSRGGIVLCFKKDEAKDWIRECQLRSRPFVLASEMPINWHHEMSFCAGDLSSNITELFYNTGDSGGQKGDSGNNHFEESAKNLCRALFDYLIRYNSPSLSRAMATLSTLEDPKGDFYQYVTTCVDSIKLKCEDLDLWMSLTALSSHVEKDQSKKADSEKGGIRSSLLRPLNPIFRNRKYFEGDINNCFTFDRIFAKGEIYIIDLPCDIDPSAVYIQKFIKFIFQKRIGSQQGRTENGTFIYADECQNFISPSDPNFFTWSRGYKHTNIYLTQGKSAVESKLGDKAATTLFQNCATTICCMSIDNSLIKLLRELIGRQKSERRSENRGYSDQSTGNSSANHGHSISQAQEFIIEAADLRELSRGGFVKDSFRVNYCDVGSISLISGSIFHVNWKQDCRSREKCGFKRNYGCVSQAFRIDKKDKKRAKKKEEIEKTLMLTGRSPLEHKVSQIINFLVFLTLLASAIYFLKRSDGFKKFDKIEDDLKFLREYFNG